MFTDDIITRLEAQNVGTLNENIFETSLANIPILVSGEATLQITGTGGTGVENTHNATVFPAYLRPTSQLVARADTPAAAREMADAAFQALFVTNSFINSGWYRSIRPLQSEPIDLGIDVRKQSQFAFNVIGDYNRRA